MPPLKDHLPINPRFSHVELWKDDILLFETSISQGPDGVWLMQDQGMPRPMSIYLSNASLEKIGHLFLGFAQYIPREKGVMDKEKEDMIHEATELRTNALGKGLVIFDRGVEEIMGLIADYPHRASIKPCPICRKITEILGEPFWCLRVKS